MASESLLHKRAVGKICVSTADHAAPRHFPGGVKDNMQLFGCARHRIGYHATVRLHMDPRPAERRNPVMTTHTTDRIEKQILLKAPRARVWRALTDSREFGAWFKAVLEGSFDEGATVKGRITHPGYEHMKLDLMIERIEPERRFSFRWHPYPIDPAKDYSAEPTTLVEFTLEEKPDGTLLTVTESGFDRIPIERRAEALKSNDGGWAGQMKAIDAYLRQNA
jgi:uncharacterized protein YndB with AHSA1/START domain